MFAAAAVLGEILYVTLGANYHVVELDACYRCAQPSPAFLEMAVKKLGVRTIVNLRGDNSGKDWYVAEHASAERLGVPIVDISLASNCPPTTAQFRQLIHLMDEAPRPILLHCHSGSDRTGLAAMMFELLQTNGSLEKARSQISIRYGHKFWSEANRLHAIPEAYAEWLKGRGEEHSPGRFREWALTIYRERDMWSRIGVRTQAELCSED